MSARKAKLETRHIETNHLQGKNVLYRLNLFVIQIKVYDDMFHNLQIYVGNSIKKTVLCISGNQDASTCCQRIRV